MKIHVKTATAVALLVAAALSLQGCINAEEHDYITYDANADEFHMLAVLTDIGAKDDNDLQYLGALYKNRDHLILPILPGSVNVFPLAGFGVIRIGDNQAWMINPYASRPSSTDVENTKVSLNSVKITPGKFFGTGTHVGYYQSVTIPGPAIDTALAEVSQLAQTPDLSKGLQTELDRRTAGGKTYTWDDLAKEAHDGISQLGAAAPTEPANDVNPLMVLQDDSLKNLVQAIDSKSLAIRREKSALVLELPLTAADRKGAVDIFDTLRKELAADIKIEGDGKEANDKRHSLAVFRAVLKVADTTATDHGFRVSIDLVKFAHAVEGVEHARIDMNDQGGSTTQPSTDVRAYLDKQGIPVDDSLTLSNLEKDFSRGTLPANPSDKPVTPGDGLAGQSDTPPATAP